MDEFNTASQPSSPPQPLGALEADQTPHALNTPGQQRFVSGKALFKITGALAILIGGIVIYRMIESREHPTSEDQASNQAVVRNTLPALKTANPVTESDNARAALRNDAARYDSGQYNDGKNDDNTAERSPQELLRERRLLSPLKDQDQQHSTSAERMSAEPTASTTASSSDSHPSSQGGEPPGELQGKMQPLRLDASTAGILGNRSTLLTQGTMIDCVLATRLITTQPGMTACYVSRDIYSANGRVVLVDRGSKVIGHYQGGMAQGQARIFILWSRIETPQGVIITMDSPGTGPLGEGGVGGTVETHFWQRFGSAILLSLIDDGAALVMQKQQRGSNPGQYPAQYPGSYQGQWLSTQQRAQDMAAEALKNSINIPPTLYKNQGERIAIFVARDLDFGRVYALKRRFIL